MWSRFPGEIASDLSQYHHRRIADWHKGKMGSYEFLELCEYLPDEGAFKTAQRKGDWSEPQEAAFQTANVIAVIRAGLMPDADTDVFGERLFLPPSKLRELFQQNQQHDAARESVYDMATISRTREDDN